MSELLKLIFLLSPVLPPRLLYKFCNIIKKILIKVIAEFPIVLLLSSIGSFTLAAISDFTSPSIRNRCQFDSSSIKRLNDSLTPGPSSHSEIYGNWQDSKIAINCTNLTSEGIANNPFIIGSYSGPYASWNNPRLDSSYQSQWQNDSTTKTPIISESYPSYIIPSSTVTTTTSITYALYCTPQTWSGAANSVKDCLCRAQTITQSELDSNTADNNRNILISMLGGGYYMWDDVLSTLQGKSDAELYSACPDLSFVETKGIQHYSNSLKYYSRRVPNSDTTSDQTNHKEYNGYVGCYVDAGDEHRMFPYSQRQAETGSHARDCRGLCKGYEYFALQASGECWCGDSWNTSNYPHSGYLAPGGDSECGTYNCNWHGYSRCGIGWRNQVYKVEMKDTHYQLKTVLSEDPDGIDPYLYLGCYSDYNDLWGDWGSERSMPEVEDDNGGNGGWTINTCRNRCIATPYKYFGVQNFGSHCYCSDQLRYWRYESETMCSQQCSSNNYYPLYCGGPFRNSVYLTSHLLNGCRWLAMSTTWDSGDRQPVNDKHCQLSIETSWVGYCDCDGDGTMAGPAGNTSQNGLSDWKNLDIWDPRYNNGDDKSSIGGTCNLLCLHNRRCMFRQVEMINGLNPYIMQSDLNGSDTDYFSRENIGISIEDQECNEIINENSTGWCDCDGDGRIFNQTEWLEDGSWNPRILGQNEPLNGYFSQARDRSIRHEPLVNGSITYRNPWQVNKTCNQLCTSQEVNNTGTIYDTTNTKLYCDCDGDGMGAVSSTGLIEPWHKIYFSAFRTQYKELTHYPDPDLGIPQESENSCAAQCSCKEVPKVDTCWIPSYSIPCLSSNWGVWGCEVCDFGYFPKNYMYRVGGMGSDLEKYGDYFDIKTATSSVESDSVNNTRESPLSPPTYFVEYDPILPSGESPVPNDLKDSRKIKSIITHNQLKPDTMMNSNTQTNSKTQSNSLPTGSPSPIRSLFTKHQPELYFTKLVNPTLSTVYAPNGHYHPAHKAVDGNLETLSTDDTSYESATQNIAHTSENTDPQPWFRAEIGGGSNLDPSSNTQSNYMNEKVLDVIIYNRKEENLNNGNTFWSPNRMVLPESGCCDNALAESAVYDAANQGAIIGLSSSDNTNEAIDCLTARNTYPIQDPGKPLDRTHYWPDSSSTKGQQDSLDKCYVCVKLKRVSNLQTQQYHIECGQEEDMEYGWRYIYIILPTTNGNTLQERILNFAEIQVRVLRKNHVTYARHFSQGQFTRTSAKINNSTSSRALYERYWLKNPSDWYGARAPVASSEQSGSQNELWLASYVIDGHKDSGDRMWHNRGGFTYPVGDNGDDPWIRLSLPRPKSDRVGEVILYSRRLDSEYRAMVPYDYGGTLPLTDGSSGYNGGDQGIIVGLVKGKIRDAVSRVDQRVGMVADMGQGSESQEHIDCLLNAYGSYDGTQQPNRGIVTDRTFYNYSSESNRTDSCYVCTKFTTYYEGGIYHNTCMDPYLDSNNDILAASQTWHSYLDSDPFQQDYLGFSHLYVIHPGAKRIASLYEIEVQVETPRELTGWTKETTSLLQGLTSSASGYQHGPEQHNSIVALGGPNMGKFYDCAPGYTWKDGDVSGWGEVNGVGNGQVVKNCQECADLCTQQANNACESYECSDQSNSCNLNAAGSSYQTKRYRSFVLCMKDVDEDSNGDTSDYFSTENARDRNGWSKCAEEVATGNTAQTCSCTGGVVRFGHPNYGWLAERAVTTSIQCTEEMFHSDTVASTLGMNIFRGESETNIHYEMNYTDGSSTKLSSSANSIDTMFYSYGYYDGLYPSRARLLPQGYTRANDPYVPPRTLRECHCGNIPRDGLCQSCEDVQNCAYYDYETQSKGVCAYDEQSGLYYKPCFECYAGYYLVGKLQGIAGQDEDWIAKFWKIDLEQHSRFQSQQQTSLSNSGSSGNRTVSNRVVNYPLHNCLPCLDVPNCDSYNSEAQCIRVDSITGQSDYYHGIDFSTYINWNGTHWINTVTYDSTNNLNAPNQPNGAAQHYRFCSRCSPGYFLLSGFCQPNAMEGGTICTATCEKDMDIQGTTICNSSDKIELQSNSMQSFDGVNAFFDTPNYFPSYTSFDCGIYCLASDLPTNITQLLQLIDGDQVSTPTTLSPLITVSGREVSHSSFGSLNVYDSTIRCDSYRVWNREGYVGTDNLDTDSELFNPIVYAQAAALNYSVVVNTTKGYYRLGTSCTVAFAGSVGVDMTLGNVGYGVMNYSNTSSQQQDSDTDNINMLNSESDNNTQQPQIQYEYFYYAVNYTCNPDWIFNTINVPSNSNATAKPYYTSLIGKWISGTQSQQSSQNKISQPPSPNDLQPGFDMISPTPISPTIAEPWSCENYCAWHTASNPFVLYGITYTGGNRLKSLEKRRMLESESEAEDDAESDSESELEQIQKCYTFDELWNEAFSGVSDDDNINIVVTDSESDVELQELHTSKFSDNSYPAKPIVIQSETDKNSETNDIISVTDSTSIGIDIQSLYKSVFGDFSLDSLGGVYTVSDINQNKIVDQKTMSQSDNFDIIISQEFPQQSEIQPNQDLNSHGNQFVSTESVSDAFSDVKSKPVSPLVSSDIDINSIYQDILGISVDDHAIVNTDSDSESYPRNEILTVESDMNIDHNLFNANAVKSRGEDDVVESESSQNQGPLKDHSDNLNLSTVTVSEVASKRRLYEAGKQEVLSTMKQMFRLDSYDTIK